MRDIIVIAHDLRSTHNVGSLMRTAEGLGVSKLYLTGYTPYPLRADDKRLPHISRKLSTQISKTALGAEEYISWEYFEDIKLIINKLTGEGYHIAALEQTNSSVSLFDYLIPEKLVLILGNEADGLPNEILDLAADHIEIPMQGRKESFNVVIAAAVAVSHLKNN